MNLLDYSRELSRMLPKKYHYQVHFVGGVLLNRRITDVDIFVYGRDAVNIQARLNGRCFSNNKELEVLDSLSTDDFYDSKNNSLTEYILTQGLVKNVPNYEFKRLTNEGMFLSKLAAFEQREEQTLKDLTDIQIILGRFDYNIPKNLAKVIEDFDLSETYERIMEYKNRYSYY